MDIKKKKNQLILFFQVEKAPISWNVLVTAWQQP